MAALKQGKARQGKARQCEGRKKKKKMLCFHVPGDYWSHVANQITTSTRNSPIMA
jgi:hypothetical protein